MTGASKRSVCKHDQPIRQVTGVASMLAACAAGYGIDASRVLPQPADAGAHWAAYVPSRPNPAGMCADDATFVGPALPRQDPLEVGTFHALSEIGPAIDGIAHAGEFGFDIARGGVERSRLGAAADAKGDTQASKRAVQNPLAAVIVTNKKDAVCFLQFMPDPPKALSACGFCYEQTKYGRCNRMSEACSD